jgi:hypothetical protein
MGSRQRDTHQVDLAVAGLWITEGAVRPPTQRRGGSRISSVNRGNALSSGSEVHVGEPELDEVELDLGPGTLAEAEIYARLFEALGALPDEATLDRLTAVAREDRPNLLKHAAPVSKVEPAIAPVLLYRTLCRARR